MKVVIIGSLSAKEKIGQVKSVFASLGFSVVTPFDDGLQEHPLVHVQQRYYEEIKSADLVVAVPKVEAWEDEPGSQTANFVFGESTCYELAVAVSNVIPVVYWPAQGSFLFTSERGRS